MAKSFYNDKVLDHFQNPRNVGVIEDADAIGTAGNPKCGDVVRMYLKIKEDIIIDTKVKVLGCSVAIAAASVLSEMVKGKTIDEALSIKNENISNVLGGLPPRKMNCSVLAEAVLRDAIYRYKRKL
jgi:nitrogen fixation NifU-like protein